LGRATRPREEWKEEEDVFFCATCGAPLESEREQPRAARKGAIMDKDILLGKWKQLKGEFKKQWGNLTDDDLDKAKGDRDKLLASSRKSTAIQKTRPGNIWTGFWMSTGPE